MPRAKRVTASRSGRPTGIEAEQLNERLLQAARQVFLQEGFQRASLERICEAAGITKRTLYRKYADKAALLSATHDAHVKTIVIPSIKPNEKWTLEKNLTQVADALLEWLLSEDVIRMARLGVEVHALLTPEQRAQSEYLSLLIFRNVEDALRADRPAMSDRDRSFYAQAFMRMIVASRHVESLEGKRPPGYSSEDRALTRRFIHLFINGWSGI